MIETLPEKEYDVLFPGRFRNGRKKSEKEG